MNLSLHTRRHLGGYTRRELLVGSAVVFALMLATARELRHRPALSCGAVCSPCGGEAVGALERWVAAQTNAAVEARPATPVSH